MKIEIRNALGMILIMGIFLIGFVSALASSYNPQYISPSISSSYLKSQGVNLYPIFNEKQCNAGQDFIIQVSPLGCEPTVVRSDLLEEQNVPVFCQLQATKINPLIDVNVIKSISFKGQYPEEVSGVGFYPAQAAIKSNGNTLLNSPILANIGYAVIVLKQQPNESSMPESVSGNLTAMIKYDIENAFGIGKAVYYLPNLDNNQWQEKYTQYGFWNGRGYLKAESIDVDSAVVSVYSDANNKISTLNLQKGQTSDKVYLPGFFCLAGLQLRLDGLEVPDTRAKLNVNGDIVEVAEREKFLENSCQVRGIEKQGIDERVSISCRTNEGVDNFDLRISPKIKLNINGVEREYSIGERLSFSDDQNKNVYLAFAGTKGNSGREDDLYVRFVQTPYSGDKLTDNMLSEVARYDKGFFDAKGGLLSQASQSIISSGSTWVERISRYLVQGSEISNVLEIGGEGSFYGAKIKILGHAIPNDKPFDLINGQCVTDSKFDPSKCGEGDILTFTSIAATMQGGGGVSSGQEIITLMGGEWKVENGASNTYTNTNQEILSKYKNPSYQLNSIKISEVEYDKPSFSSKTSFDRYLSKLSESQSDERKVLRQNYENAMTDYRTIINSFPNDREDANSQVTFGEQALVQSIKLAEGAEQKKTMLELCDEFKVKYQKPQKELPQCDNLLNLASSETAVKSVLINGNVKDISFKGVYEPGFDEYGVEILISNAGTHSGAYPLQKNQRIYFSDNEFIELKDINNDFALFDVSSVDEGVLKNVAWKTSYLRIDLNGKKVVGEKNYGITLAKVNIKKQARISVIPGIDNAGTEANVTFNIGIEKRAIQLSPGEIKDRISTLNDSINKWEDNSESLGNVVKGFNAACLATGTYYTVKNFFGNLDGQSIARTEVMRSDGGWTDICKAKVAEKQYSSLDECFLKNSDAIDKDVENRFQAMQGVSINDDNCGTEAKNLITKFGNSVIDPRKNQNNEDIDTSSDSGIFSAFSVQGCNDGEVSLTDIRDLKTIENELALNPSAERKNALELERYQILSDINANVKNYAELQKSQQALINGGVSGLQFSSSGQNVNSRAPASYFGYGADKDLFSNTIKKGTKFQPVTSEDGNQYIITLKQAGISKTYTPEKIYKIDSATGQLIEIPDEDKLDSKFTKLKQEFSSFELRDASSYKNNFLNPEVKYFESEPYKGFPSEVPFDLTDGWYVAMKQPLSGFENANIKAYDDSGQVTSFWLCNVGQNGKAEFNSGVKDDTCQQFNFITSQIIGTFPGLDAGKTNNLVKQAASAINSAKSQYKSGVTSVLINRQKIKVGNPAVGVPEFQCQDFMSPSECNILFNVCDPVVCPSSRCNLGGSYYVSDVVQSGIVGSSVLCLNNFPETKIPVCLSGIKAGIDSLISVQKDYRDCLQTNLDTGKTVGICDEIHSIYLCDFFWSQAAPFADYAVPKIFNWFATGSTSGGTGGGEYANVQSAWQNAQNSVDYMTQYYGANSFSAFKALATDGIGKAVCQNFVSATYPSDVGLSALIEPRSPPQFHAWFSETTYTTATVPATSQYKVFYHIYAGENNIQNIGAYYNVYLKSPAGSSLYQTNQEVTVASGYIAKGDYASETKDFTAPSGYKELCIRVNAQEECGFEKVSTSFALNYLNDLYVNEQAGNSDIKTEKECVSGTSSLYSFINPNLQAGATNAFNPELYDSGITRVCSTDNPGKGTDPKSGTASGRWIEVGSCDGGLGKVKCYLDTESVKDVIKSTDLENETIQSASSKLNELLKQSDYIQDFEAEVKKIESLKTPQEKIDYINSNKIIDRSLLTNQKAKVFFIRAGAYAKLVVDKIKLIIPSGKPAEVPVEEKPTMGAVEVNLDNIPFTINLVRGARIIHDQEEERDGVKFRIIVSDKGERIVHDKSIDVAYIYDPISKTWETLNSRGQKSPGLPSVYNQRALDVSKYYLYSGFSYLLNSKTSVISANDWNTKVITLESLGIENYDTLISEEYANSISSTQKRLDDMNTLSKSYLNRKCSLKESLQEDYIKYIGEASRKYDINPDLILSVIMQESNCDYLAINGDSTGLMQVDYRIWFKGNNKENLNAILPNNFQIPSTENEFRSKLLNPEFNIIVGSAILRLNYPNSEETLHFECNSKDVVYKNWEISLRKYVGKGCDNLHLNYVEEVLARFVSLSSDGLG